MLLFISIFVLQINKIYFNNEVLENSIIMICFFIATLQYYWNGCPLTILENYFHRKANPLNEDIYNMSSDEGFLYHAIFNLTGFKIKSKHLSLRNILFVFFIINFIFYLIKLI